MRLNPIRVSRSLDNQKKITTSFSKIFTKNRDAMIVLSEARYFLLKGEQVLRDLLERATAENIDG